MGKHCYSAHTSKKCQHVSSKNPFLATKEDNVVTCSMLYPCFSLAMAMYSSTEKQDRAGEHTQGSAVSEHWSRKPRPHGTVGAEERQFPHRIADTAPLGTLHIKPCRETAGNTLKCYQHLSLDGKIIILFLKNLVLRGF